MAETRNPYEAPRSNLDSGDDAIPKPSKHKSATALGALVGTVVGFVASFPACLYLRPNSFFVRIAVLIIWGLAGGGLVFGCLKWFRKRTSDALSLAFGFLCAVGIVFYGLCLLSWTL